MLIVNCVRCCFRALQLIQRLSIKRQPRHSGRGCPLQLNYERQLAGRYLPCTVPPLHLHDTEPVVPRVGVNTTVPAAPEVPFMVTVITPLPATPTLLT